jgi:hypothetical protein
MRSARHASRSRPKPSKSATRLDANIPLIGEILCPLSFVDLPAQDYTQALVGVYELNRVELLRDAFAWTYERSAARYAAVRQSLGEPNPFRSRHREALIDAVGAVIRTKVSCKRATGFIRGWASKHLPESARAAFLALVETELLGLHEGNFSRFRVRPWEFEAWREK